MAVDGFIGRVAAGLAGIAMLGLGFHVAAPTLHHARPHGEQQVPITAPSFTEGGYTPEVRVDDVVPMAWSAGEPTSLWESLQEPSIPPFAADQILTDGAGAAGSAGTPLGNSLGNMAMGSMLSPLMASTSVLRYLMPQGIGPGTLANVDVDPTVAESPVVDVVPAM